ncbi:MAG TPA: cytochrome c [Kofleriaceae bacterium]|nr:cytochrome c [Kofleriaceae bacterium]
MRACFFVLFSSLVACGGSSAPEPVEPAAPAQPEAAATPPAGDQAAAPQTVEEQAARGAQLYGQHCAKCHGDAGQGAKAPALVGKEALPLDPRKGQKRDVQFKTAMDVFTWVKGHMPPDAPGSLADDEYVAILSFDLKANGVKLERPLDGEQAAQLNLH